MTSIHRQIIQFYGHTGEPPAHITELLQEGEEAACECPVCYETILPNKFILTRCNHWYCSDCYETMLTQSLTECSVCRTPFHNVAISIRLYQETLQHLYIIDTTRGSVQRRHITKFLYFIQEHPELLYKNMYLQKILKEKTAIFKQKAEEVGDIELFVACLTLQPVTYAL
jgi:hypothetical protein